MNSGRFPAGSVRASVTAFGDAWAAAFIGPQFVCAAITAEIVDARVTAWCDALITFSGRRATMRRRAFVGLNCDGAPS